MKLENYCCLPKSSYELINHAIGLFFEYPDRPMFDKIKPGPFDVRYKVRPDRPKPEKTGVRPSLKETFCYFYAQLQQVFFQSCRVSSCLVLQSSCALFVPIHGNNAP